MKIKIFATLLSGMAVLSVSAAPLTPSEALLRARGASPSRVAAKLKTGATPVYTAKTAKGVLSAYVFNVAEGGYVIVSADDAAYPVLGYSDSGKIDSGNMSPELKWWLGEYGRQIEWSNENGVSSSVMAPQAPEGMTEIAPLVKTLWDQGAPYNNDCPTPRNSSTRCVTGCVATSMAQVMNYHKYPEVGEGIVSYKADDIGRTLSLNFANKSFDWANMLDSYRSGGYNDDQAAAVAYLMKACGFSVEMNYGTDASGASGADISVALKKYFKYDKNLSFVQRIVYSGSQWMKMVYDNLKNVGPVIMNGSAPLQGGHSFVCDGYDGNGYFHFNWGWNGISDGYYLLDALNPEAQGTGGAAGGFNFSLNGIFGIQPPTGLPEETNPGLILQYGSTVASVSGRKVVFDVENYNPLGWGNGTDEGIIAAIGAIITPIDGTQGEEKYVRGTLGSLAAINLGSVYSYVQNTAAKPEMELPELPDGTYRLTLASRTASDESAEWLPVAVPWGCLNCCQLNVSGGVYSITNLKAPELQLSDLELKSGLYAGRNATVSVKIVNNSDIELTQGFCARLYNSAGKLAFVGESIKETVGAGETVEAEWVSKFYNPSTGAVGSVSQPTDYTMRLYDPTTNMEYPGIELKVTMSKNPGSPSPVATAFSFPGCPKDFQVDYEGVTMGAITYLISKAGIDFDFGFKINSGYFDSAVTISIYEASPSDPRYIGPQVKQVFSEVFYLTAPESKSLNMKIDFDQCEDGKLYYIRANYTDRSAQKYLGQLAFMYDPSRLEGIEDVIGDTVSGVSEIYNLQGQRISNPKAGEIVVVRNGSTTKKMVWKAE